MTRRRLATWSLLTLGPIGLGAAVLLLPVRPPIVMSSFPAHLSQDSVLVVPGARYAAGRIERFLLGDHYRDLWTNPLKVEVLKLHEFDGGLRPIKEGGGQETRSLHFLSNSGRRFIFRSTDKELVRLIHYGLSRSMLAHLIQDQTSASHPTSALVAAPLQAAVGLPATHPRLVVLPIDDSLGAYQARFAGLLGTFQEGPGELLPPPPGGAAVAEVQDTEDVMALLDASANHRVDARAFLTARLLDVFLNDWDRHGGQWRWAPWTEPWGTLWRPIPVDRDQAFARYDGLLLALARIRTTKLSDFGPNYPHLQGLTRNSGYLDRRLLAGLSRQVWDSIAAFVVAQLGDSVIDAAVRMMPEPHWRLSGPRLAAALKQRRNGLPAIAGQFYARLARRPEVHLAWSGVTARISYQPDGSVELELFPGSDDLEQSPAFVRRFIPAETDDIDLLLHGKTPRVVIRGNQRGGPAIEVHLLDEAGKEMPLPAGPG
jgi:hypothetical protein